jgi:hypothetical protein
MEIEEPVAGVAGGAPPAAVDIVYCCARANEPLASNSMNLNMEKFRPE